MIVGIDFDNTLVCYDGVFHKVARERTLVPADIAPTKLAVRDHLRAIGREDDWTEMQGYVYGARMADAELYPGALAFLRQARQDNIDVAIVSHKTRWPFAGPRYDLHEAARGWISTVLKDETGPLIAPDAVSFCETKQEKIARIGALGCAVFLDDLPEILVFEGFPARTLPILFDPADHHADFDAGPRVRAWTDLKRHLPAHDSR